ncbi:hypothetical protein GMA11_07155 [Granulicatella sp. zg-ZJ]|uniref:hypothetical protein n=1 Tax=Granulicatella sp. zg-ZJ TaxID=2678504 RepID=UPI0013D2A774|nr:hypothetical protein [Granulicatella sp. zg-ZJ]NEW62304.1 hypothetical protein [Granulicatella sp. zg-ZJ]NEW63170.1 hypothetical protein [Granulicatella sp. zg-ZJ]
MSLKSKIFSVVLLGGLLFTGVQSVSATSRGNLTFLHGAEGLEAMAEIRSTHTEGHMRINMQLTFDDGSTGYPSGEALGVSHYKLKSGFNWWKAGESTADYYVNWDHVHTTTAPYRFE